MPPSIRQRFRPGTEVEEPSDPKRFLLPLRQLWSRHRLDRLLRLSPRQNLLLRTQTTPTELPRSERDALLDAFGLGLLNELALAGQPALQAVLESLATVPSAPELRATVWAGSLKYLDLGGLRRELHACADALGVFRADAPTAAAWQRVALPTLTEIASREDEVLRDLLAEAPGDSNLFALLGDWASKLAFSDVTLAQAPLSPAEPALGPTPVLPATVSAGSVADEWVMKLRLPEEQPLERLHEALVEAADALRSNGSWPDVRGLAALLRRANVLAGGSRRQMAGGDRGCSRPPNRLGSSVRQPMAIWKRRSEATLAHLVRENDILPAEAHEIARLLDHRLLHQTPDLAALGRCRYGAATAPRNEARLGAVARTQPAPPLSPDVLRPCNRVERTQSSRVADPSRRPVEIRRHTCANGLSACALSFWNYRSRCVNSLAESPTSIRYGRRRRRCAPCAPPCPRPPGRRWSRSFVRLRPPSVDALERLTVALSPLFQRELDGCEGLPYATIRTRVTKELAVVAEGGIEKPGIRGSNGDYRAQLPGGTHRPSDAYLRPFGNR